MTISEERREELRISIIAAATAEFLEKGYAAASLDSIIKVAGGSKSKVYSYFGNKEELFLTVVEERCQDILSPLRTIEFSKRDFSTALEQFGITFLQAVLHTETIKLMRLVIAEGARFPKLGETFITAGPKHAHSVLSKHIEEGIKQGVFRSDIEPKLAATLFIDMISRDLQLQLLVGAVQSFDLNQAKRTVKAAAKLTTGSA